MFRDLNNVLVIKYSNTKYILESVILHCTQYVFKITLASLCLFSLKFYIGYRGNNMSVIIIIIGTVVL